MLGSGCGACAERQLLEAEALLSMFPADGECVVEGEFGSMQIRIQLEVDGARASLCASLPSEYPHTAPRLSVECDTLPGRTRARLLEQLNKEAAELAGEECLFDLVTVLTAALSEALQQQAKASGPGATADDTHYERTVVLIDHMNDSSGYTKKLQRWAGQLGLDLDLWYRMPTASIGVSKKVRVEGVYALLGGPTCEVSSFITRLKTEYVDVNKQGTKCKERKSQTLSRGPSDGTATASGLHSYDDDAEELKNRLAEFGCTADQLPANLRSAPAAN